MRNLTIEAALQMLGFIAVLSAGAEAPREVTITPFTDVATNTPTGVEVVVLPPQEEDLTIEIHTSMGTGSAIFAENSSTSIAVADSCILEIMGTVPSSVPSNMLLEVHGEDGQLASNRFSVVTNQMVTLMDAISTARAAVIAEYQVETNAPVCASMRGTSIFVTFGMNLPAGSLGPGYVAGAEIDPYTGDVLNIFSGP